MGKKNGNPEKKFSHPARILEDRREKNKII